MSVPRLRLSALMAAMALAAIAAALSWTVAEGMAKRAQTARLDQGLLLTARAVESEIERFRYLPGVLGEDDRIRRALAAPGPAAIDAANRYLETVAARSGAAQLFLMNAQGTAIAASNWNTPENLTGNTYDFRSYLRDAMAQGEGRYYAIGVTTGKPGYFLASRVDVTDDTRGVVVAMVDLRALEATWREAGVPTALMDRDGVIFLSGEVSWAYHPLKPLGHEALGRIVAERTYEGVDIATAVPLLGTAANSLTDGNTIVLPSDRGDLIARLRPLDADGWTLLSAAPGSEVRATAALWSAGAALVAMAATALAMIFNQRRQLIRLRLRQGALLEARVAERTRELAHEIDARRKTEADLRSAQETLVHTEKMAALGRMSAAIVHELSQPLAAMEATLAAAELSGDGAKTRTRIGTARNLIARMQRTTKHLKSFSRKEQNLRTLTDLDKVAENALELVAPRAKAVGVAPLFQPSAEAPLAMAGPVRLEQVCLNLLLNALDTVEGQPAARITVETAREGASVSLTVSDNGPGIAPDMLARVTEPFFSTKIGGEGLGLGLSISQAIVTEFGGRLDISSLPGTGTRVTVVLPAAPAVHEAAE